MKKLVGAIFLTIVSSFFISFNTAANAACTQQPFYNEAGDMTMGIVCTPDTGPEFTTPEQAAKTSAESLANMPKPQAGPLSPLAQSIPQGVEAPVRDPNAPIDPAAELAAAQKRADENAKILADAKAVTDKEQAALPIDSCKRFETVNSQKCLDIQTAANKVASEADIAKANEIQKQIDSQLPVDSCDASTNRFLQSCIDKKAAEAAKSNNAVNIIKLKTGYLLASLGTSVTASSEVTLVLTAKGQKTKTITTQVTDSGQILLPSKLNLAGYQVQIKSGSTLLKKVTIPKSTKSVSK